MVGLAGATASRGAGRWPRLWWVADLAMGEAGEGEEPELAATPSSPRLPEQFCAGLLWPESQGITFPPDPAIWGQLCTTKGGMTALTTWLHLSCFL